MIDRRGGLGTKNLLPLLIFLSFGLAGWLYLAFAYRHSSTGLVIAVVFAMAQTIQAVVLAIRRNSTKSSAYEASGHRARLGTFLAMWGAYASGTFVWTLVALSGRGLTPAVVAGIGTSSFLIFAAVVVALRRDRLGTEEARLTLPNGT